ncbi:MAG: bifunctional DNA primase/polymerase [Scytonematopsis contorta HA4267-MV1]|jgi:hypothetical protein|nr:bifunctional DNA primase/polymerase [Scytonematopsis contorta HA4267-MV1]
MHSQIKKVVEALELLPIEWRVVPTFGKRPLGNGWQKINYSPGELRKKLIYNQMKINLKYKTVVPTGIAVICGEYPQGNLIAVDCDGLLGWNKILEFACSQVIPEEPVQARKQAVQYLPPTVAFTSGREFRAQFLYFIPKTTQIKSVKLEHLELRGNNLASVLPPSFHPDGRRYQWLTGCSPQERNVAQAPNWVIKHMHHQYKCSVKRSKNQDSKCSQNLFMKNWEFTETPFTNINFNQSFCPKVNDSLLKPAKVNRIKIRTTFDTDIQAALTFLEVLNPSYAEDYSTWIQIGMALKSVSPSLLRAWDSWSQLSSKYKPGECAYKWQSFRREGITIRTLAKYAGFS